MKHRPTGDWHECSMDSVVDIIDPHPSHRAPPEDKEGIPFPGIGDFRIDGSIDASSCRHVNARVYDEHRARYEVEAGDIGFGRVASIGKVVRLDPKALPFAVSPTLAILKPRSISADYLQHFLQGPYLGSQIAQLLTGTTRSSLGLQLLRKLKVRAPALPEQAKIAEILTTVDRAIEQTEALIAKQQRLKTGLMQDLLTRGIDAHGNLRSEFTHPFKDSPLGRIPAEWKVKRIDELLANVDPAMRSGPFGSALLKEELVSSGVPLLGIDNVLCEKFEADYSRFVQPKKAESLKRYFVRPRDIMITIMGTVGRCCVVPDNIGTALSSKHTWTISLNQNVYSPYLACLQINHAPWVLNHFGRDEQGGIMASIKSDTLRATLLPVPPPNEMKVIEASLKSLSAELETKVTTLAKLRALKTALMQDLLTGRKPVTALL
jgi:type I restriction enzyme S subunit